MGSVEHNQVIKLTHHSIQGGYAAQKRKFPSNQVLSMRTSIGVNPLIKGSGESRGRMIIFMVINLDSSRAN